MPKSMAETGDNAIVKLATKLMQLTAPKIEFHEMYFAEHSRKVRAAVKLPLAYLGGAKSLVGIQQAMADGFDCVAMGRALIFDPDFVNKLASGAVTVSGCTACNECVSLMYSPGGTRCVL